MTEQEYMEVKARLNLVEIRKRLVELDIESLDHLIELDGYNTTLRLVSEWLERSIKKTNNSIT